MKSDFQSFWWSESLKQSSLTQVWQHACTHSVITFFFQKSHHLLCSGEIQTQTKRSVFKDKTRSLADGIPPALQPAPAFSCVSVDVVWLGLFQLDQNDPRFQPKLCCAGSFFPQSNQLKSGAVMNQTKPNTSGCEPEKRMWFISSQSVCMGRHLRRVVFVCVTQRACRARPSRRTQTTTLERMTNRPAAARCGESSSLIKVFPKRWKCCLCLKSLNILFPPVKK